MSLAAQPGDAAAAAGQRKPSPAADFAWRGIELCRRGDWQEGILWLGRAAEAEGRGEEPAQSDGPPALFYAYLGYGIARYQGDRELGLELCRRAVEMEHYLPECYAFLARTHLLMEDRRSAFQVVELGLEIDAANDDLLRIHAELGRRRPPVLRFLPRRHFANRWLGRIRHRLLGPRDRRR